MFSGGVFVMIAAILRCALILTVSISLTCQPIRACRTWLTSTLSRPEPMVPNKLEAGPSVKHSSPSLLETSPWSNPSSPSQSGSWAPSARITRCSGLVNAPKRARSYRWGTGSNHRGSIPEPRILCLFRVVRRTSSKHGIKEAWTRMHPQRALVNMTTPSMSRTRCPSSPNRSNNLTGNAASLAPATATSRLEPEAPAKSNCHTLLLLAPVGRAGTEKRRSRAGRSISKFGEQALREDGSRAALTHQPIFSFHDHVKNVVKINAEPGSGELHQVKWILIGVLERWSGTKVLVLREGDRV